MLNKYTTSIVLLLSWCLRFIAAIHCYECSSVNNSMCLDPLKYDKETLKKFLPTTTCGQGVISAGNHDFFCRKLVQTIIHKGYESDVRVTRSCGWIRGNRECYKADNEDHLETVCQCFNDECNAGSHLKYTLTAILTTVMPVGLRFIL